MGFPLFCSCFHAVYIPGKKNKQRRAAESRPSFQTLFRRPLKFAPFCPDHIFFFGKNLQLICGLGRLFWGIFLIGQIAESLGKGGQKRMSITLLLIVLAICRTQKRQGVTQKAQFCMFCLSDLHSISFLGRPCWLLIVWDLVSNKPLLPNLVDSLEFAESQLLVSTRCHSVLWLLTSQSLCRLDSTKTPIIIYLNELGPVN